ncbi:MAG: permease [Chitinivibrionales bacterium]|nr:permease [Chitinivibrionales bacterium]
MNTAWAEAQKFTVADAQPDERAMFIRKTYTHLAGAVAAFVVVEYFLLTSPIPALMTRFIAGNSIGWLAFLGVFMLSGWLARSMAANQKSEQMQYLGLGIYVVAEAFIFAPILYFATAVMQDPTIIPNAAIITGFLFAGLTAVVFTTRKDFSFLGSILTIGGFIALGLIVASAIIGFNLGLLFSGVMVLFAGGAILYDTSKVLHHYRTDQHVGASLELFASVALLFWYVLRIVMSFSRR